MQISSVSAALSSNCSTTSMIFPLHGVLALAHEIITTRNMSEEGQEVLLTNSAGKKPGPKGAHASSIYAFAHQAYWGFRFLAKKKKQLWLKVLQATRVSEIQEVGQECSKPGSMAGAGYGAAGMMEWMAKPNVAVQVLAAKKHRRYPESRRPSSQDRRMIFLGIAVAAGVFDVTFKTALRKLAEAGIAQKYLSREVHNWDKIQQRLKEEGFMYAEPVGNYMWLVEDGKWEPMRDLPCAIPKNVRGGFILHGYTPDGQFISVFSRTLPLEFCDPVDQKAKKANASDQESVK